MSDASRGSPSPEVLRFARDQFGSPAELDVFVYVQRSESGVTTRDVVAQTGLRHSHAQLVLDTLLRSGALESTDDRWRVRGELLDQAADLDHVYQRFRLRLIEEIVRDATE